MTELPRIVLCFYCENAPASCRSDLTACCERCCRVHHVRVGPVGKGENARWICDRRERELRR